MPRLEAGSSSPKSAAQAFIPYSLPTFVAADPPRHAQKPHVATLPPPRKVLAAAACRTRPSEKSQPERKVAKVKPIMGAAGNGCPSSGKTWSTIRTERTMNTEVTARPTAVGCITKNNTTMCSKPKTGTVESTLHKSRDPISRRHSLGTADSAAFGRSESRGALPFTPAPWAASVPPRKAVTEMKPKQDSKQLSAKEIRRSKLQEWMNSKGKSYKRPAMTLPPKKPAKAKARLSFWAGIEEEDDLNSLVMKINMTLSDCLRLIDEGLPSETFQTTLTKITQAEKFAKYWMCKARLLERSGTFDVIGLYEQAVRSGAVPIEELRETIFDIMKNTNKKAKAVTFDLVPEEGLTAVTELDSCESAALSQNGETIDQLVRSPNILTRQWAGAQGSALKFQIAPLPSRVKEPTVAAAWKMLNPVRRSLRIERSVSRYAQTLFLTDIPYRLIWTIPSLGV
ncbi:cytoskeleton-associated protein 2-like [Lissotriton helveticus]